jgi:hypothetical protein
LSAPYWERNWEHEKAEIWGLLIKGAVVEGCGRADLPNLAKVCSPDGKRTLELYPEIGSPGQETQETPVKAGEQSELEPQQQA